MSYSFSILSNSWTVAVLWPQNWRTAPSIDRVGITELAQCVYVKPSIGRVGGWGSPSRWFLDSDVSAVFILQLIFWQCLQQLTVCNQQFCFGLLAVWLAISFSEISVYSQFISVLLSDVS